MSPPLTTKTVFLNAGIWIGKRGEIMKFSGKALKRGVVALSLGMFLLLATGATAKAQGHHSRSHSYYDNSHSAQGYYRGSYSYGIPSGGYVNRHGHNNNSVYNNGYYYGNSGYNTYSPYSRGYYNDNSYYNGYGSTYGHRDSRTRVKRFFHHALGGH